MGKVCETVGLGTWVGLEAKGGRGPRIRIGCLYFEFLRRLVVFKGVWLV